MDNKRGRIRHLNNPYRMSNILMTGTPEREKAGGGGDGDGGGGEDGKKSWNNQGKHSRVFLKKTCNLDRQSQI